MSIIAAAGFALICTGFYLIGWVGGVVYAQTGNKYHLSIFGSAAVVLGTLAIIVCGP